MNVYEAAISPILVNGSVWTDPDEFLLMITKATAYIGLSHIVGTYFGVRKGVNGRDCNCLVVFSECGPASGVPLRI
jgi:hypothetical protein